jgi:tRNA dimethylallyltransferase
MKKKSLPKIIVVLGPTASGKSDLAVKLAKKFKGEVVSADSRQVYKGLDIGAGKITEKEMKGVPHHMLDVVSPKKIFTIQDFKIKADKAIKDILKRGKVPILCGGTGFYIQSIVDNLILPEVPPNKKLRKELESKTIQQLFSILVTLDKNRALTIDPSNPARLMRAIEIATALGNVPKIVSKPQYQTLQIGLTLPDELLKTKIHKRLHKRFKQGMVAEVEALHTQGISWKRLEFLGLEYKYIALFLQKKITYAEMVTELEHATWHYAKRQKTWFKRDNRIEWYNPADIKDITCSCEAFIVS